MKNKLNIILACLWLLIALFFSWILFSKLSDGNNSLFNGRLLFSSKVADRIFGDDGIVITNRDLSDGDITTLYKDYSFDASQIESFTIDLVSASVHLQPSEYSDITVKLYGNWNSNIEPRVSVERQKLSIKSPNVTFLNKVNLGSRKVVISIPESALSRFYDADISTVSGSIHVSDVSFGELTTESTSGSVHFDGVAEILSANTVSGSIHTSGTCSNCKCETVSGSIHVETDKPLTGRNNFDSVSGSVHITIPEESGFEFEWETVSGSVKNAFYSGKCGKSGSQIIGDGKTEIKAETVSGSIHLNKN
ncbi:MAG: DUF4097 family beta strand repeat protein [Treponema sp.]|nr:DUF4097 family beta strand repeat protein [Candidatus Treponema caballi]